MGTWTYGWSRGIGASQRGALVHTGVHRTLACNEHCVTLQTIPKYSEYLFSLRGNVARSAASTSAQSAMDG
jgi:hypothetical protein